MAREKTPKLSTTEAEAILQEVFLECYADTNSIPIEQMEQYSNYRTERLSLQRVLSIALFIAFILLPIFFIPPRFNVSESEAGDRGLPVYTVTVYSRLPIKSVTAIMENYSLPVCQREKNVFTVEPTANGSITVTVTLFSGQWNSRTFNINVLDETAPKYIGSSLDGEVLYIYVKDDESKIDYDKAYLEDEKGQITKQLSFNEEVGYFEITSIPESGILHVFDKYENELTVSIAKKQ